MGWVKVDTRFPGHPKTLDVGPLGEALWLRGLCYAGEQLTDGLIPEAFVRRMGDMKAGQVAARLVDAGLWSEVEGGYRIHDFLDWQRSRDEAAVVSSKRSEAGRKGGKQKASNVLANAEQGATKLPDDTPSKPLPDKRREEEDKSRKDPSVPEGTPDPHDGEGEKATPYPAPFETFWSSYPRTGGTKAKAFRAWDQLKPNAATREAIAAGVATWSTSEHWALGFVVHAERFLRDRQWQDQPPPPKGRANGNGHHATDRDDVERLRRYDAEKRERKEAMFLDELEPDSAEMAALRSRLNGSVSR